MTLPAEGEIGVVDIGPLTLENGAVLDDVSIAVQRWGELSPEPRQRRRRAARAHRRLARHRPGRSRPSRPPAGGTASPAPARRSTPTAGARSPPTCWAAAAARPGRVRWPATESRGVRGFPLITVRDQVNADVAALAALGITEVAAVIGGSMGGARALEWMVGYPDTGAGRAGAGRRRAGHRRPDRHPEHPDRGHQGRPGLAGRRLPRHRPLPRDRAWRWPAASPT